ncbi:MAG TPA: hypothetical protein VGB55_10950 [Tepidisphaeraceae bacterium]|jgi:hypothetical protein
MVDGIATGFRGRGALRKMLEILFLPFYFSVFGVTLGHAKR